MSYYRAWYYINANKTEIYKYSDEHHVINAYQEEHIAGRYLRFQGVYCSRYCKTKIEALMDICDFINKNGK